MRRLITLVIGLIILIVCTSVSVPKEFPIRTQLKPIKHTIYHKKDIDNLKIRSTFKTLKNAQQ